MEETVHSEQPGTQAEEATGVPPHEASPNPQQVMLEQLAAELTATRQQLAVVQQQLALEQAAVQNKNAEDQAVAQQRYGQMIQSVEQFVEGKATVADVVKTVSTNVAQDDALWKGALVGAAAAIVLTSGPVRDAMGKTFGALFPGLQGNASEGSAGKTVTPAANPEKQ